MAKGSRTWCLRGLNKYFSLKFCEGFRVLLEMPEQDRKMHRPKRCKNNNKDEDNSPNIQSDKNYQGSSKKN